MITDADQQNDVVDAGSGSDVAVAADDEEEDTDVTEKNEQVNPVEALQTYWYETTARIRMAWFAFNALAVHLAVSMSYIAHVFFEIIGSTDMSPSMAFNLYTLAPLLLLTAVLVDEMVDVALDAMSWPSMRMFQATFFASVHSCFRSLTVRRTEILILSALEGLPVLSLVLYLALRKGPIELRGILTFYSIGGFFFVDVMVLTYLVTHVHVARSFDLTNQMVKVYHKLGHLGSLRKIKNDCLAVEAHPSRARSRRCTRRAKLLLLALGVQLLVVVLHFLVGGQVRNSITIVGQLLVLVLGAMSINAYVPKLLGKAFTVTLGIFVTFALVLFIGAARQVPERKPGELQPLCLGPSAAGFGQGPHDLPLAFTPPLNAQGYGYPVCSAHWGNRNATTDDQFGILDLASLAFASSFPTQHDIAAGLGAMFNGTSLEDWRLLEVEDRRTVGRWIVVDFPKQKVRVVAVRGTSNMHDVYADLDLYARVSVFQAMERFTPVVTFLGDETLRALVKSASVVTKAFGLHDFWDRFFDVVARCKRQALEEGYSVVLTGHSLGGALVGAAAAKYGIQAVGFSAPGLFYQSLRFDFDEQELKYMFTEIQPGNDMVPLVDVQRGSVNWIRCGTGVGMCHRLVKTSCELWARCGDPRGRDWRNTCRRWYDRKHLNM